MFVKHYTSVNHMIVSPGQSNETSCMQTGTPVLSSHFREESTYTVAAPNVDFPVQIVSLVTVKAPLTHTHILRLQFSYITYCNHHSKQHNALN